MVKMPRRRGRKSVFSTCKAWSINFLQSLGAQPSSTPVWSSAPITLTFVNGTSSQIDLRTYLTGFTAGVHGVWISSGSLPTGTTLNADLYHVDYDGIGAVVSPTAVTFDVGTISEADWYYRVSQPGVLRSTTRSSPWPARRFASSAEWSEMLNPDHLGDALSEWDSSVRFSTGGGSVKQQIPKTSPQTSAGDLAISFGDVKNSELKEYRAGETVWISVTKMYDANFLDQDMVGEGAKNWILSMTDKAGYYPQGGNGSLFASSSAPYGTIVAQFTGKQNALYLYHTNTGIDICSAVNTTADGTWSDTLGHTHIGTSNDRKMYNAIDNGAGVTRLQSRYHTKFGLRESGAVVTLTSPSGSHPAAPEQHAFRLYPMEWVTWIMCIDIGTLSNSGTRSQGSLPDADSAFRPTEGYLNSRIRMWGLRHGRDSDGIKLIDVSGITLTRYCGDDAAAAVGAWILSDDFAGYGKIHLTNYFTDGVADAARNIAYSWTGDLIVSTAAIPFPRTRTIPS